MSRIPRFLLAGTRTGLYVLLIVVLVVAYISAAASMAGGSSLARPAWAAPGAKALKRISNLPSVQTEPVYLNNLDCSLLTYRLVSTSNAQTGCFTETAFGLFDSDNDTVIYAGTDEGLPLLPYSANHILAPWPKSGGLLVLTPDAVAGTYVSLYKGLSNLEDKRNSLGRLTGKRITTPTDLKLSRPDGRHLLINSQTLAFSDGGSWMVAETLFGSFVRVNLASLDMKPFAKAYGSQGSPGLLASSVAASHDGNFIAIYNKAATEFKVYDLTGCQGTLSPILAPQTCPAYDYRSFIEGQVGPIKNIRHIRFSHDGMISFNLTATDASKSGIYVLAPTASINFLSEYLALGDSYTSGEGAFDYLEGTDTARNTCHLSRRSYPLLVIDQLFNSSSGHSVACSGARIRDVADTSDDYAGQTVGGLKLGELEAAQPAWLASIKANFTPGYLAQSIFVRLHQPRITTVSIGGNDIGFGEIIKSCVMPSLSKDTCFNSYEDRVELKSLIDRTIPSWAILFRNLKNIVPGGQVYAIGYPDVVDDKGQCGTNVRLNQAERLFARELVDYINKAMGQAAATAGVSYVDITQALAGHRLCETNGPNLAVNGLTSGNDAGPFGLRIIGRESYHTNALGHLLVSQAILRSTNNLTASSSVLPEPPPADKLLNQPATGRPVTNKSFQAITKELVRPEETVHLSLDGVQSGLRPGAAYLVRLDGPDGQVIGSLSAAGDGSASTDITLPGTLVPGGYTIDVTGPSQTDKPLDITQPILVQEDIPDPDSPPSSSLSSSGAQNTPGANLSENVNTQNDTRQPQVVVTSPGDNNPPANGSTPARPAVGLNTPLSPRPAAMNQQKTLEPDKTRGRRAVQGSLSNPVWWGLPALIIALGLIIVVIIARMRANPYSGRRLTPGRT